MAVDPKRGRHRSGPASDPGFEALKAQVIARTGHHYYKDKDDLLFDRLVRRFRAVGLSDATTYALLLDGPGGPQEWEALEAEITIGETFFFRYAEQFAALKDTILPGLVAARAEERALRIWSAGCASGAEPYSVAILLHELLGPALPQWNLSITGTDINAEALAKARQAHYGRWALRNMDPEKRACLFQATPPGPGVLRDGGYRLRPEFRRMVRFERQNLLDLADGTVPGSFTGFDLILCRNVLIYFGTEAVAGIVQGFGGRLRSGGWLLVGHAEPNPSFGTWLSAVHLPGTIAYRRRDEPVRHARTDSPGASAGPAPPIALPEWLLPVLPVETAPPPRPSLSRATAPEVLPSTAQVVSRIRALSDSGEIGQAWRLLQDALAAEPTEPALRYYEGLLAIGLGREDEAERALRGALFLDRDFVMAHYQLGLLLTGRGRHAAARRAFGNALRLAEALAPDTILPEGDGATAGELIASAGFALARGDAP